MPFLRPGIVHPKNANRGRLSTAPARIWYAQLGGTQLRKITALLLVALAGAAIGAGASPKLARSWKNPNYTGGTFQNILVLAINGKAANRAEFEDELVAAITRPGETAAPSYEFLPRPDVTPIAKSDLRWVVRKQKFDAIVTALLTKNTQKTNYVPPDVVYQPVAYYSTFYGYYDTLVPVVYSPGYMETEKRAQVEVNVYSTAKPDGELVWTGTTNVFDSGSVMKVIKDLVKLVTKELEKQNVIAPGSN
jgi:hypothetical protein